jgi:hypothetical protein
MHNASATSANLCLLTRKRAIYAFLHRLAPGRIGVVDLEMYSPLQDADLEAGAYGDDKGVYGRSAYSPGHDGDSHAWADSHLRQVRRFSSNWPPRLRSLCLHRTWVMSDRDSDPAWKSVNCWLNVMWGSRMVVSHPRTPPHSQLLLRYSHEDCR